MAAARRRQSWDRIGAQSCATGRERPAPRRAPRRCTPLAPSGIFLQEELSLVFPLAGRRAGIGRELVEPQQFARRVEAIANSAAARLVQRTYSRLSLFGHDR